MKHIPSLIVKLLVAILIISGLFAINVQAQTDPGMIVSIPFPFTVGTQRIAPGTYDFSMVSTQFLLSVRNVITGEKEMFAVRPEQQRASEQKERLIFHHSEGCSVLSEVHFPGTSTFTEVNYRQDVGCVKAKRRLTSTSLFVGQN
jgi:hypothetical protein